MSAQPLPADAVLAAEDSSAREQALDPRRSILLQAPAGSGKTAVLTLRFLRLLCSVDEPEEILAITFTRKAAAEMRKRILGALSGEVTESSAHAEQLRALAAEARTHAQRRGWDLAANPGRLRVQTIDSLNRSLAAQLPLAARGGGDLAVAEDPSELYRAAARRTLLDAESDAHLRGDAELLFERLDNDFTRAERLLSDMLRARAHWLPRLLRGGARLEGGQSDLLARIEGSLQTIVAERLQSARALIGDALLAEAAALLPEAARRRIAAGNSDPGPRQLWAQSAPQPGHFTLEHWQGLSALALTEQATWRVSLTRREGFPPEETALKARASVWLSDLRAVPGARDVLIELAQLPPAILTAENAHALASLARLLTLAAGELELMFRQRGRVDYAYVAAAARRALMEEGAPTDLGLRLGARIRHLLIDEFQDTSIEQYELIETLTANWEPGDGRTLFAVGDPMQSIYLFREAEVGLFLRTRTRGLGALELQPLALTRNFRSAPQLLAWSNRIFAQVFPERDDPRTGAVRYAASLAARTATAGGVHLHAMANGDVAVEAHAIASLIRSLRADDPTRSIAILLAARSHAAPIVRALESLRIPVAGVDLVPMAELSIVRDLTALARALDHPGDQTAWLAVLRAPWCGMTLTELTVLLAGASAGSVWEAMNESARTARLEPAAQLRLERVRCVLEQGLAEHSRLEPAAWLERTWLRLGGPAACASAEDVDHARTFFTQLSRWCAEPGWVGPLGIEEKLAELYATHEPGETAVQVMTIHRAKGLEFDHVILPGLARRLRSNGEPLLRWLELPRDADGSDLLMAAIPSPARRGAEPLTEYLKFLQTRRAALEKARLLYVAATRARLQLHLFAELPEEGCLPERKPPAGTLLSLLWPALAAEFLQRPVEASGSDRVAVPRETAPLVRLVSEWTVPQPTEPLLIERLQMLSFEPTVREEGGLAELDGCGASVRAVRDQLRRCARQGRLPEPGDALVARALRERLTRLGVADEALGPEVDRAMRLLESCLADRMLRWIFSSRHAAAASPLELTGIYQGRITRIAVDRSFIDEQRSRWLITFDASAPGAMAEGGPAAALERRRPELEKQRALAQAFGPEPVRLAVYFPALQRFETLDAGGALEGARE